MTQQSTTKERANFRILLLVFVPVCGMGTIAQAKAVSRTATRYLYILNCDAILQKFDTVSRKQVSMTSLAKHSSLIPRMAVRQTALLTADQPPARPTKRRLHCYTPCPPPQVASNQEQSATSHPVFPPARPNARGRYQSSWQIQ